MVLTLDPRIRSREGHAGRFFSTLEERLSSRASGEWKAESQRNGSLMAAADSSVKISEADFRPVPITKDTRLLLMAAGFNLGLFDCVSKRHRVAHEKEA